MKSILGTFIDIWRLFIGHTEVNREINKTKGERNEREKRICPFSFRVSFQVFRSLAWTNLLTSLLYFLNRKETKDSGHGTLPIPADQCDQIWRKNRHLGKLWQSFLSEWKNIETTFLANLLYFRANFCRCKWQKMNKSRVHLVTLPEDPGYSLDIVNFYLNKTEWASHSFQTSTQLYNK